MNAEQWNARYPVGTRVLAYPSVRPEHPVAVRYREAAEAGRTAKSEQDPCKRLVTVTRTPAWTLGHGVPVVSVDGYTGGICLTHVDPAPAGTDTFELPLSRCNVTAVDDWLDKAGVFAKGYWEVVNGKLAVTGLRIGSDYQDRIVAKFGDTIVRHADGTHTVRRAIEAGEVS